MYIKRHIDNYLLDWKNTSDRKPLLLRGARQVGKTTAVKHLGEQFNYFIEANFEKQKDLRQKPPFRLTMTRLQHNEV